MTLLIKQPYLFFSPRGLRRTPRAHARRPVSVICVCLKMRDGQHELGIGLDRPRRTTREVPTVIYLHLFLSLLHWVPDVRYNFQKHPASFCPSCPYNHLDPHPSNKSDGTSLAFHEQFFFGLDRLVLHITDSPLPTFLGRSLPAHSPSLHPLLLRSLLHFFGVPCPASLYMARHIHSLPPSPSIPMGNCIYSRSVLPCVVLVITRAQHSSCRRNCPMQACPAKITQMLFVLYPNRKVQRGCQKLATYKARCSM
ncbi:hypothetical protein BKA62DRAFT_192414 [Auriculariales sp. MPI-PUGE-AT-0066]|nr:hypothetical protein BKA62DRAFT_192414 [Auriculariales sp. MPI-PUGE-AT-0066]